MLNLKRRIAEARKADEGFTLIELAVVILIIGILLLLAIPSFLGVRKKAQDKAAQSSLKVLLTDAKAIYGDANSYTAAGVTGLQGAEPGYSIVADTVSSSGPKIISVAVNAAGTEWKAASWAQSSNCFFIADSDATGTSFARTNGAANTACTAGTTPGTAWNTAGF
jgi:type IV pilus assembly protein PilA